MKYETFILNEILIQNAAFLECDDSEFLFLNKCWE